jgi:chorismate synthase
MGRPVRFTGAMVESEGSLVALMSGSRFMQYRTAGESHGRALVTIVSGVPAGVRLTQEGLDADLRRRQVGYGRGGRMRIEADRAQVLAGVRGGRTTGAPVAIMIANRDFENWSDAMDPFMASSAESRVTAPRPGHADLPGVLKTGSADVRDVLERASARETAARVAAGAVARHLLSEVGVRVVSWVESIGDASCGRLDPDSVDLVTVEASDVRCPDASAADAMRGAIDAAGAAGESVGGIVAVAAFGLVPGLGTYAEARERLDARIAAALMSIPAIKGVEIGDGFGLACRPGSQAHDAITFSAGEGYGRLSNHAGGIEGGMTNGEPVVVRAAMKPIPTLMRPLATVDIDTRGPVEAAIERSDVCAVPAAAVVAEAELALVLADAYCVAFGSNCISDLLVALAAYRSRIA